MSEMSSVCDESLGYVMTRWTNLTERERGIAEAAARAAYRWTMREIIETLQEKAKAS